MCIYCNFKNHDIINTASSSDVCKATIKIDMKKEQNDYFIAVSIDDCNLKVKRSILYCPFCGRKLDEQEL